MTRLRKMMLGLSRAKREDFLGHHNVPLIVILEKVSAKERYPQLLLLARACGNVKNLSLLTGYTGGGRRPAVMNMFP